MSGIVRSVKKAFSRLDGKKIAKGLAIAGAIYFATGLAGGAMGNETLGNMPGIQGAADFLGIESGAFAQGAPPTELGMAGTDVAMAGETADMPEQLAGPESAPEVVADAPQGVPAPQAVPQVQQATPSPAVQSPTPAGPATPGEVPAKTASGDLALTKPGETKGIINSTAAWFKRLSPAAQQILAGGAVGGASAMMQALAAKSAQEDAEEREERAREDKIRRGRIPAFAEGSFKPKSGIINSVRG